MVDKRGARLAYSVTIHPPTPADPRVFAIVDRDEKEPASRTISTRCWASLRPRGSIPRTSSSIGTARQSGTRSGGGGTGRPPSNPLTASHGRSPKFARHSGTSCCLRGRPTIRAPIAFPSMATRSSLRRSGREAAPTAPCEPRASREGRQGAPDRACTKTHDLFGLHIQAAGFEPRAKVERTQEGAAAHGGRNVNRRCAARGEAPLPGGGPALLHLNRSVPGNRDHGAPGKRRAARGRPGARRPCRGTNDAPLHPQKA